jgi:outer membrane receptor protein involved in Fe transport
MTGGFSAEYGSRFGGVIDVVTKSGFTMKRRGSVTPWESAVPLISSALAKGINR